MNIGDKSKLYESLTESRLMPLLPIIIRIDGRAFHTFTRGLKRPYDERLSNLMISTTKALVKEFKCQVGYTQSDEISLLLIQPQETTQFIFNGRVQKIVSVFASYAAAHFNKYLEDCIPSHGRLLASFDARVFQTPNRSDAVGYFLWRERDAVKNSTQMAAQSVCSHKELQGKHRGEQNELLFQKGVNFNNFPAFFKRGSWIKFVEICRKFNSVETSQLPFNHKAKTNPNLLIKRSEVQLLKIEDLSTMSNKEDFLFGDYYKVNNAT